MSKDEYSFLQGGDVDALLISAEKEVVRGFFS